MRAQTGAAKHLDAVNLEGEVREAVQYSHSQVQPLEIVPRTVLAPPVPDYVSHRDDVSEIGRLSAEAIVKEYEETAKEIETMGEVIKEMVQRCEGLHSNASSMLKEIKATAARYRKEGKRMFTEIESCSSATDEVRRMCEAFRDKIAVREAEAQK
ncbi:MAG: hypothetical protein GY844_24575 [Bradyrhizobium sp.]|nr:hypothetical protein [Bradyrhizobium sp.]